MAGNLRDIKELEAEIEAAGLRGITKQQILDALKSQSKVGGAMSINAGDTGFTLAGGWNRIDTWNRSIDTQGVQDGLADETDAGGWYRIRNAAAGDYTCSAAIRFTGSLAGEYEIRIGHAGGTTPYHDAVTIEAGVEAQLAIAAAVIKDVARGERLQLEMRGPNGSTVTISYGQFGVWR